MSEIILHVIHYSLTAICAFTMALIVAARVMGGPSIYSPAARSMSLLWRFAPWVFLATVFQVSLFIVNIALSDPQDPPILSWATLATATIAGVMFSGLTRLATYSWPAGFSVMLVGPSTDLKIEIRGDEWLVHFDPPRKSDRDKKNPLMTFLRDLDRVLAQAQREGWSPKVIILDSHLMPRDNLLSLSQRLMRAFRESSLHTCKVEPVRRLKGPAWLMTRLYAFRFGPSLRAPDGFSRKAIIRLKDGISS